MPPTRFDLLEGPLVMRLFELIGLPYRDLPDPKVKYGRETGADVEIHHDDRRIGIQVTEFHADEGLGHPEQGLRATRSRGKTPRRSRQRWRPRGKASDAGISADRAGADVPQAARGRDTLSPMRSAWLGM